MYIEFKIKEEEKKDYFTRNIQIPQELFDTINKVKGDISLNKFVTQAVEYAINNIED